MFKLALPKMILVRNWRLVLLYRLMFVIMAFVVLARFVHQENWASTLLISSGITGAIWTPRGINASEMQAVYERLRSLPGNLCEQHGLYDYAPFSGKETAIGNHSCAEVCGTNPVDLHCLHGSEMFHQLSPRDVFFVTKAETTVTPTNNLSRSELRRLWVPLEDVYLSQMAYTYHLDSASIHDMKNLWLAKGFSGSS